MKKVFHVPNCKCCFKYIGDPTWTPCERCGSHTDTHPFICYQCQKFDERCRVRFFIQGWAIFAAGSFFGALVAVGVVWVRYG